MDYTKEIPTKPGWYFIKSIVYNGLIEIKIRPGYSYLCFLNPSNPNHTSEFVSLNSLSKKTTEYKGPIEF